MPTILEELIVELRANDTQLRSAISNAEASSERAARSIEQRFQRAGQALTRVGAGLSIGITAPIIGIGIASLKSAAEVETLETAFTTLLGSGKEAESFLQGLQQFAASTPFRFPELANSARSLLAFGVAGQDVIPTLQRIGDVSAGIGASVGDIAEIYGKARVQGRLFAEDINQLTGRGIPIIGELAEQFGVTEAEVKSLVESGVVGFDNLEQAFRDLTAEGGQFFGLTQAQSETTAGKLSTLRDNVGLLGAEFGEVLLPALNSIVTVATDVIQSVNSMDEGTRKLTIGVAGVAAALGPTLIGLGQIVTIAPKVAAGFGAIRTAAAFLFGPAGLLIAAAGVVTGITVALGNQIRVLDEYSSRVNVIGLDARAAEASTRVTNVLRAQASVVEALVENGKTQAEALELAANQFAGPLAAARADFDEAVRSAAAARDSIGAIGDIDPDVNVTITTDFASSGPVTTALEGGTPELEPFEIKLDTEGAEKSLDGLLGQLDRVIERIGVVTSTSKGFTLTGDGGGTGRGQFGNVQTGAFGFVPGQVPTQPVDFGERTAGARPGLGVRLPPTPGPVTGLPGLSADFVETFIPRLLGLGPGVSRPRPTLGGGSGGFLGDRNAIRPGVREPAPRITIDTTGLPRVTTLATLPGAGGVVALVGEVPGLRGLPQDTKGPRPPFDFGGLGQSLNRLAGVRRFGFVPGERSFGDTLGGRVGGEGRGEFGASFGKILGFDPTQGKRADELKESQGAFVNSIKDASEQFKASVVSAGADFASAVISGDAGSIISAGGGLASTLIGGLTAGNPILGALLTGGVGIFTGLLGSLFGGRDETTDTDPARRPGPSQLRIDLEFNQYWTFNGPTSTGDAQAINDAILPDVIGGLQNAIKDVIPRIERIEAVTGLETPRGVV